MNRRVTTAVGLLVLALGLTFTAMPATVPAQAAQPTPAASTTPALTPTQEHAQITKWLSAYGLDGEFATGTLRVDVADTLNPYAGADAAGVYIPGEDRIILNREDGFGPWVLAHEIGHWYAAHHPDGGAIRDYERMADCTATLLLAGTADAASAKVTACSLQELTLAGQIVSKQPLTALDPTAPTVAESIAAGVSPYTSDALDLDHTYPTLAQTLKLREAAGITTGLRPNLQADLVPLTIEHAAALTMPDQVDGALGLVVYSIIGLRQTWGADLIRLGTHTWAIDEYRAWGHDEVLTKIINSEGSELGASRCLAPVLLGDDQQVAAWGCTRGRILEDATIWRHRRETTFYDPTTVVLGPTAVILGPAPARPLLTADPSRIATPADTDDARCYSGIYPYRGDGDGDGDGGACAAWHATHEGPLSLP